MEDEVSFSEAARQMKAMHLEKVRRKAMFRSGIEEAIQVKLETEESENKQGGV